MVTTYNGMDIGISVESVESLTARGRKRATGRSRKQTNALIINSDQRRVIVIGPDGWRNDRP